MIKQSVQYVKNQAENYNRKIGFSMTTNATLINKEIADFLTDNDFNIIISLDGPKELHDENRVDINGNGSFNNTIAGIKALLRSRNVKHKEKSPLVFNMVVDGENVVEKYDKIQKFLDNSPWMPENIQVLISAIDYSPKECTYIKPQTKRELAYSENRMDPLTFWSDNVVIEKNKSLFSEASLNKGLHRIHNRLYTDKPVEAYGMNGCCVPGHRRMYVTVSGSILPCEKVGDIPPIGHVDDGFWIDSIKKHYVYDFIEEAKKYCKECWAVNLCGLCYTNCYDGEGIHYNYRHQLCVEERIYLSNLLSRYYSILEVNPEMLKELDNMEIR